MPSTDPTTSITVSYWRSTAKYQPLLSYTDPVHSFITSYRTVDPTGSSFIHTLVMTPWVKELIGMIMNFLSLIHFLGSGWISAQAGGDSCGKSLFPISSLHFFNNIWTTLLIESESCQNFKSSTLATKLTASSAAVFQLFVLPMTLPPFHNCLSACLNMKQQWTSTCQAI